MKFLGVALAGFLVVTGALYFILKPNAPLGIDIAPGQANGPIGLSISTAPGDEPRGPRAIHPLSPARKDFSKLTEDAFSTLPRQTDPGSMDSKTLSQPPAEFIARLQALIDIGKAIKRNSELVDDGIYFYRQCALYLDLHLAIRARCLSHFVKLSEEYGKSVNMDEFDNRLRKLARAFPN